MSPRPPCIVALSTGEREEVHTVAAAVTRVRELLRLAPAGSTGSVTRRGLEPRYYSVDDEEIVRRAPHPGGRPTLSPDGGRRPVLVRLAPRALAALDGLVAAEGTSRGLVIDRLVLEASGRP